MMRKHIATDHLGRPVHERRKTGYVTQALINRHGSYAKALAVLNGEAA